MQHHDERMDVFNIEIEEEICIRACWLQLSDIDAYASSTGEIEWKDFGLVRAELFFLDQEFEIIDLEPGKSQIDSRILSLLCPYDLIGMHIPRQIGLPRNLRRPVLSSSKSRLNFPHPRQFC